MGAPLGAMGLRLATELEQQSPATTLSIALFNQLSFGVVAGVAIFAFSHVRKTQLQLREMATHDSLTHVLNARSFAERLEQELERNRRYARPMAVLYLDLDNFKHLNDKYGHAAGDAALLNVVRAIRLNLRVSDLLARLGGDEFALLLPETDSQEVVAILMRLQEHVAEEMTRRGWPVTLSIGAITNFFDTLGIGSFATTTTVYRLRKLVSDELIPGTLNVGHTLPTIAQALIYTTIIEVDMLTPQGDRIVGKNPPLDIIARDIIFGEGPVWDNRAKQLYFTDIIGDTIWKWKPGVGQEVVLRPSVKANGTCLDLEHRLVVAGWGGRTVFRQEKDGSWWDYPLYDYHQPYGTAFALMTLARCR